MIYVEYNETGKIIALHHEYPSVLKVANPNFDLVESRNDWKSMADAERIALLVSEFAGVRYLAVDEGENVSPRYDIIEAPRVGEKVSYGFNGDYYPDGVIRKVSKNFQVTTSTGNVYRRRRQSSTWKRTGGTWSLVKGHVDERNPCF